jgi:hypothetical protein
MVSIHGLSWFNPNSGRWRLAFFLCSITSLVQPLLVVRTKLDGDFKPLAAKSLTVSVKCYETRVGRINVVQSNVLVEYTKVLWSKQDGVEYEPIGNLDLPFRISMPAKVAGFSTAAFVDYRCVWRLEAGTTYCSYFFTVPHLIFNLSGSPYPCTHIWRWCPSDSTFRASFYTI